MFGFLNIYKPAGKTSHDIVSIMRRLTGIRQIGHTGTLDPFAEGVLPICIGKATRLIEYLNDDKAYSAVIQLGSSTTTYDTEGETVKCSDKKVNIHEIETVLDCFKGEIEQLPPIYSAIKVKGKKLYEYARNGEEVKIEPRKVTISKLELTDFDEEKQTLKLYIECSKGTYIRSIANDLGEKLGVYGHLIKLIRVKAGKFEISESISLEDIKTDDDVTKHLINPLIMLDYPIYKINDVEKQLISNGMQIELNRMNGITILTHDNNIAAVGCVTEGMFKPAKVFI